MKKATLKIIINQQSQELARKDKIIADYEKKIKETKDLISFFLPKEILCTQ